MMEPVKQYKTVDKSRVIEMEQGKLPPQAKDLELAILGAMLLDSQSVDEGLMVLKNDDVFYFEAHRKIFSAIKSLYQQNTGIDFMTVSEYLKSKGELESIGGVRYLVELAGKITSGAHIEYHARLLLQYFIKRQMIAISSKIIQESYNDETDVFDLMNESFSLLEQLSEQVSKGSSDITQVDALQLIQQRLELLSKKDVNEICGIKTGFKSVDLVTSGWQPTDLIVIAARPGMGKTSLVLKTMLANVKAGVPVGMISLEMSTQQLVTRKVAINSHFHLNQLFRQGFSKTSYFSQFLELKREMESYPAYYDDRSVDLYDVMSKIRLWKRKYGVQLVIIDYLQLMSCKSLGKNSIREQEIATITRSLKKLAKELSIPIILLSQLSRDVETRGSSKRPILKDLRESGAIEQDADVVCFIYRPSYYGIEDEELQSMGANTEFIFAKHRNGSLDRCGLYFDENKTKFMDPEDYKSDTTDNEVSLPNVSPSDAFDDDLPY